MTTKSSSKVKEYNKIGKVQKIILELLIFNRVLYLETLSAKDIHILDSLMKYELITDVPIPSGNTNITYRHDSGRVAYDESDESYSWVSTMEVVEAQQDSDDSDESTDIVDIGDEIDTNTKGFVDLIENQEVEIQNLTIALAKACDHISYLQRQLDKRDKQIRQARKLLK